MSKEIIYKCPRYEERKKAEKELEGNYYDNLLIQSPPICFGCTGGLKSRATKNQKCCCCLVIDTEKVRWRDKKTIRLLKTIAKAVRRQKVKDRRREGQKHDRSRMEMDFARDYNDANRDAGRANDCH